jgi:hypothetical protein
MHVTPIDPGERRQVRQFLDLPFRIYKDIPQWVPPLDFDIRKKFDRQTFPFYKHSEAAFYLAYDDPSNVVGRIAAIENTRYNDYNGTQRAFFYLFECENDPQAAAALFEAACTWARERGLTEIIGPKGFTALDGRGLLVEGFEHRPAFGIPYNPRYYIDLIESQGFETQRELVSGYMDRNTLVPKSVHVMAEQVKARRGLVVHNFRNRADLRQFAGCIKDLYNSSLSEVGGNPPLTDDEVSAMAEQIIWFANPRLIKAVYKDDVPVGFLLAYPDISAAIQRSHGRLFPFGWLDVLIELRRTKWVNLNGIGIKKEYRGSGGTVIMYSELEKSLLDGGFAYADLVQTGTENDKIQRELRRYGVDFYKKHRVYKKDL